MVDNRRSHDDYLEHVLEQRTILLDGPPTVQDFDSRIQRLRCSTFALQYDSKALQTAKTSAKPQFEQRLIELVRENSSYRRELRFFRAVFEAMENLRRQVSSSAQQFVLNYYLDSVEADIRWLDASTELNAFIESYTALVDAAAHDWVMLTQQQKGVEEATRI